MHILFIDESGFLRPSEKTEKGAHFVLGGVVIPEEIWPKLASDLKRIKAQFRITGEIKWRYFNHSNNKNDNSILHLTGEERDNLRIQLLQLIPKYKSIKIIGVVCDVVQAYFDSKISGPDKLYRRAYKVLTERFQYFLQDLERSSGQTVRGIIVCDHRNHNEDSRLRLFHQELIEGQGLYSSSYQNLVEGLFVAPSHFSVGIQFADLVAGAIFRKYNVGDERFYDLVRPSIRVGPNGLVDGYGIVRIPKDRKGF